MPAALSNIQGISATGGFWFQLPTQARRLQGEADCPEGADAVVTEANFTNGPRGMHRVPWVVLQVIADFGGFEGGQYKGSYITLII